MIEFSADVSPADQPAAACHKYTGDRKTKGSAKMTAEQGSVPRRPRAGLCRDPLTAGYACGHSLYFAIKEDTSMCGIIGYTGVKPVCPILLGGLRALEYRGYDSAGIALSGCTLATVKRAGRISVLEEALAAGAAGEKVESACCGIGHTRWATHGAPTDENAHPHATPRLALVHNGIIENDRALRRELEAAGYTFVSETDTESAAKLLDSIYGACGDPVAAMLGLDGRLSGAYALAVIFADRPHEIYAIRRDSPLIAAQSPDGVLLASDIPAILPYTRSYYRPDEGEVVRLRADDITFFDANGEKTHPLCTVNWDVEEAERGGYSHFMRKELGEAPEGVRRTLSPLIRDGLPHFGMPLLDDLHEKKGMRIVACGTAMHAGLIGRTYLERLARLPVAVEIASEFRYRDPIISADEPVLLLSQSGETADTLAALRLAKANGVPTAAIVNVIGSSVAREADAVMATHAGPEIAVASTKAYTTQAAMLALLAVSTAYARGLIDEQEARARTDALCRRLPEALEETIAREAELEAFAARLAEAEHVFYIGRGVDYDACVEGSLKLKEISYIHSEAYAAGELKHGTISLIEPGVPVLAVSTDPAVAAKVASNMREVRARGGEIIAFCTPATEADIAPNADFCMVLDENDTTLAPLCAVSALHLLAYHVARLRGCDIDKPRNLAKSVTVE